MLPEKLFTNRGIYELQNDELLRNNLLNVSLIDLRRAVKDNQVSHVRQILTTANSPLDVEQRDERGTTLLMYCAGEGKIIMLSFFLNICALTIIFHKFRFR